MTGEDLCYGYEGGFEGLTAEKVISNMRIMQENKKTGVTGEVDVVEGENNGND